MDIDRRMVLGGLAAGAIAKQVSAAGTLGASPASRMRTFMLMRGALDEKLISSWMSAITVFSTAAAGANRSCRASAT